MYFDKKQKRICKFFKVDKSKEMYQKGSKLLCSSTNRMIFTSIPTGNNSWLNYIYCTFFAAAARILFISFGRLPRIAGWKIRFAA